MANPKRIERLHETDNEGVYVYETREDLTDHVDHVARMRSMQPECTPGLGYYAGSIPAIVAEAYCNKIGIKFEEFLNNPVHIKNLLNDPDYSAFRIWKGQV